MGIVKNTLLLPFKTAFKLPTVDLPVSVIPIPPTNFCMFIILVSFFFTTGGFVYCAVRGAPFMGGRYTKDGKVIRSWYQPGQNQFGAEGFIIAGVFTIGAFSLLCAMVNLENVTKKSQVNEEKAKKKNTKKNAKKDEQNDNSMADLAGYFGMTGIFWCFLTYVIFTVKMPSFSVKFTR